jgi:hypothetical protein
VPFCHPLKCQLVVVRYILNGQIFSSPFPSSLFCVGPRTVGKLKHLTWVCGIFFDNGFSTTVYVANPFTISSHFPNKPLLFRPWHRRRNVKSMPEFCNVGITFCPENRNKVGMPTIRTFLKSMNWSQEIFGMITIEPMNVNSIKRSSIVKSGNFYHVIEWQMNDIDENWISRKG